MGFRFRKSINLGKNFRINISKKGIGYSYGIKGIRHSVSPDGKEKTTYSIPGTGISYSDTSQSVKSPKMPQGSSRMHTTILLLALLIACGIPVLMQIISTYSQPTIPPPPNTTKETNHLPEIVFSDSGTIFLSISETAHINLELRDAAVSPSDIVLINDNPASVSHEYSANNGNNILYTITAVSPGISNLHAQSIDGKITSDIVQIIVDPPETAGISGVRRYVLNTSSKIAHDPNCSYAPAPQSDHYSISDYLPSDYSACRHCQ